MGIELVNLGTFQRRFTATSTGALQKELVSNLHKAATPIHQDMQAACFTHIQRRAMDSVEITKRPDGLEFTGGQTGGLGSALFLGAEFGGMTKKKKRVRGWVFGNPVRRPPGSPGVVVRRTTMQFLPWLFADGYFFYPTIFGYEPKLIAQSEKIITDFMTGR